VKEGARGERERGKKTGGAKPPPGGTRGAHPGYPAKRSTPTCDKSLERGAVKAQPGARNVQVSNSTYVNPPAPDCEPRKTGFGACNSDLRANPL